MIVGLLKQNSREAAALNHKRANSKEQLTFHYNTYEQYYNMLKVLNEDIGSINWKKFAV